jgi:hypothetical protein
VYSSVVSLRGIRIVTFLSELNGCETWSTDVSCVLGKLHTQEKVYIVAGPEFGLRETRTDNIQGSLRTEIIRTQMVATICRRTTTDGILPSKAEKDIWMRDKVNHYEYVAVYVDDLLIAVVSPSSPR